MSKVECNCKVCKKDNKCTNKFCIYCGTKIIAVNETIGDYDKVFHSPDGLMIALLSKVAKSEGSIGAEETLFIEKVYDTLSQSNPYPNLKTIFQQILVKEKEKLDNVEELCLLLLGFNITNSYKLDMLTMLIEIAYLDGKYSLKEKKLIVKIVHYLHIDYEAYKTILALYLPKAEQSQKQEYSSSSHVSQGYLTIDECYDILHTSKNTDNATLKKNYRNMAKEYHADILQGKELPKELIAFAQEKLKLINFSYAKLKKYRNF